MQTRQMSMRNMRHTIAECVLIMQTLLISCHAWNGIIMDSSVGGTQLVQPNHTPKVVSVNFGLPNYWQGEAVTLPNGCVYFLGGNAGTVQKTVKRFNPVTNTSTAATPMNFGRCDFGATVVGNQIVVCGGKLSLTYIVLLSKQTLSHRR